MQASNHMPRVVARAFPPPQAARSKAVLQARLWLPTQLPERCPLVVRVTGGEDVSREVERLTQEGFAVYVWYADQETAERDLSACAVLQTELEQQLDKLLQEHPVLDEKTVFVDGWMSAYLIFHTQRFKAVIQRPALINPTTAYGNCTAGWTEPFGNSLEEMMLVLAERSVLVDVDACKTPCLVLWTEGELRYSREQSEQLYAAMKDRNPDVACRMAVFTETQWEKHGLREIMNWWKRFLTDEGGESK